jgi:hypothetical protein
MAHMTGTPSGAHRRVPTATAAGREDTRLVVIRGNSASGKSSVAQGLRDHYGRGIAIVGQDVIRRNVLREHDTARGANIALLSRIARPRSEARSQPQNTRAHNWASLARRLCQARLRQPGEQYTAEAGRSTPTVHDAPHSGQLDVTPAWTASVLVCARRIRRQCRDDRQADEQNTAVTITEGISGPPHPRHNCGPASSSVTTTSRSRGTPSLPMQSPYAQNRLGLVEVFVRGSPDFLPRHASPARHG